MEKQSMIINNILSNDNLNCAYKQVIKNKGAAGIDGMECEALFSHLRTNGAQLKESVRNQAYNPLPVRRVEIPKEDGSKRKLGIPTVTDRLIQQAVAQVLTPIYEPKFSDGYAIQASLERPSAISYSPSSSSCCPRITLRFSSLPFLSAAHTSCLLYFSA